MTETQIKAATSSKNEHWATPSRLFDLAYEKFGPFGLDAAAEHNSAKCEHYITPKGEFAKTPGGNIMRGSIRCALKSPLWNLTTPATVWINPPYGKAFNDPFADRIIKAATEENIRICALVKSAPGSRWYQKMMVAASHIYHLSGRVRFTNPETGKPGGSPLFDSDIMLFNYPESFPGYKRHDNIWHLKASDRC